MISTEAIPGHIIETKDVIIGVLHDALTPVLTVPTVTPHIADHLHIGANQLTHRTAADHNPIQHTNQVRKNLHKSSSHPSRAQGKLHDKRNPRVTIDDPHMNFYSSADNSSDSEEDSEHLN